MTRLPKPGSAMGAELAITYDEAERRYYGTLGARDRFDELTRRDSLVRAVASLKARGEYDPQRHPADPGEPLTLTDHLEVLAAGEVLARSYRHPSYVHQAVSAGASPSQIADATGRSEHEARQEYRDWADGQHGLWREYDGRFGLSDTEHAAAVAWAGDLPDLPDLRSMLGNFGGTRVEVATVLDALADAADLLTERASQWCGGCNASPADLCDEHAADLDAAAQYRALAKDLKEARQ